MHGSEPERVSSLVTWISRGLNRGDKVIYADAPRPAGGSLLDSSDRQGTEFAAALAEGRLAALPLVRFYPQGDQEAIVDQALAEGFRSVRLAAEASAAFDTQSMSDHMDIEQLIDRLCRTRPVSALCEYATSATEGTVLRELVAGHRYELRSAAFHLATGPGGLVLRGEIDRANADVLATVLDVAVADGKGVVRLDLAALEFMDVAACRQLVYASQDFRQAGGHVVLATPQPTVAWTLRLLAVDQFAGIDLVGG
nr:MEDS domain-containing protein [Planosporangium thailandense]